MRILVVEDEQKISDLLTDVLAAEGFVVEVAHDGQDGWIKGGTEFYSAAILDISLPKLDGISVLRKWREENSQYSGSIAEREEAAGMNVSKELMPVLMTI